MMSVWQNKDVLITGHTGFKGGWLVHLLDHLGARIHGFALPAETPFNMYEITDVKSCLSSERLGTITDKDTLTEYIEMVQPSVIIHMAAQPLVRNSYLYPAETFETNVLGTVNILEAANCIGNVDVVLNVTTDKVYWDMNWDQPYKETDRLAGKDPYAASKACSELVTMAYHESFFQHSNTKVATARSGNVIGGGDFSKDRLLPDIFRSERELTGLRSRSPNAVRPWQHVLEPISGYVKLIEMLLINQNFSGSSFNFGPRTEDEKSVGWIVEFMKTWYPSLEIIFEQKKDNMHETEFLRLDSSKARSSLNWQSYWPLQTSLRKTCEWNDAWLAGEDMKNFTYKQIDEYFNSKRAG